MERKCGSCGAFLLEGWDACRFCALDSPPPAPQVAASAADGPARPPVRPASPRRRSPAPLILGLALVLVGCGALALHLTGDDGSSVAAAAEPREKPEGWITFVDPRAHTGMAFPDGVRSEEAPVEVNGMTLTGRLAQAHDGEDRYVLVTFEIPDHVPAEAVLASLTGQALLDAGADMKEQRPIEVQGRKAVEMRFEDGGRVALMRSVADGNRVFLFGAISAAGEPEHGRFFVESFSFNG